MCYQAGFCTAAGIEIGNRPFVLLVSELSVR